jgi:hypothetical protein
MHKQATTWTFLAALAVLAGFGLGGCSPGAKTPGPEADKNDAPKSLPREIVKAWRDAGAEGFDGPLPTFVLKSPQDGVLAQLPNPGAAFELQVVLGGTASGWCRRS